MPLMRTMPFIRVAAFPVSRSALMAAAALFGAGFAGLAQANDVYWSVGVASPGVSIGVTNSRPVVVVPAPVYVQPAPIYRRPAPIFVQPQVVYVQPGGHGRGWYNEPKYGRDDDHKRGDKHGRHDRNDRNDRHRFERHGHDAYAPVHVHPQVPYGRGTQFYGGVSSVQPGHPSGQGLGWR